MIELSKVTKVYPGGTAAMVEMDLTIAPGYKKRSKRCN